MNNHVYIYDALLSHSNNSFALEQIIAHISKVYGVDLDPNFSLPKIKGSFKGSHMPVFDTKNQVKIV